MPTRTNPTDSAAPTDLSEVAAAMVSVVFQSGMSAQVVEAKWDDIAAAFGGFDPDPPLDRFHRWHAARADLLRRLGDTAGAAAAVESAARLATDPAERRWLTDQRRALQHER